MTIQGKSILEDPPLYPGNRLPTNIQLSTQNTHKDLLGKIDIGTKVPKNIINKLNSIHVAHEDVFNGDLSKGYNGASGNFDVTFTFNNDLPPPPHKGNFPPYYKQAEKEVLQAKIEELELQNIVAKESSLGIAHSHHSYASPCMLARKVS